MFNYIKVHMFQICIFLSFIIVGFIQHSQNKLIFDLNNRNNKLTNDISNYKYDIAYFVSDVENRLYTNIADGDNETFEKLNARIDIIDSALKSRKKRRILVITIRQAIRENTNRKINIRTLNNIAIAVIDFSYQYSLPISKLLAQIKVESDFNVYAISHAGAQGLMQVMPGTLKYISLKENKHFNAFNIYHSVQMGASYMAEQLLEFDDYDNALRAYNWGPNYIRKYLAGEITNIPEETRKYVPQINYWAEVFGKYGFEHYDR